MIQRSRFAIAAGVALSAVLVQMPSGWAESVSINTTGIASGDHHFSTRTNASQASAIAPALSLDPASVSAAADAAGRSVGGAIAAPAGDAAAAANCGTSCPLTLSPGAAAGEAKAAADASPSVIEACACGCGIFEVGTSSMLPQGQGGMLYLEYDFQNQDRNFSGVRQADAANNPDKDIRTHFITAGLQYFFNRSWGVQVEVPYDIRHFDTTTDDGNSAVVNWGSLGDIRVQGYYTGFFPDMSAGLIFGAKFPTGRFNFNSEQVDRDTQIGTGSTDILLGGFYRHALTADQRFTWFTQINADLPVLIQDHYRPGFEFDGALGLYYSGISIAGVRITPVGQMLGSVRTQDHGENSAAPVASGYQRLLLSPGLEVHLHPFEIYGDVEIPVYQNYTGDQLVAPALFKLILAYHF